MAKKKSSARSKSKARRAAAKAKTSASKASTTSKSTTSKTPTTTKSSSPAIKTSVGMETAAQTAERARALLGSAYKPSTPAPSQARLDEIAGQTFIKPEVKAAYDATKQVVPQAAPVPPVETPPVVPAAISAVLPTQEAVPEGNATTQEGPQPVEQAQAEQAPIVQGGAQQGMTQSLGGQAQTSMPQVQGNMATGSVVDYLNSVGQASDFSSRKRMAEGLGISGYTGSAAQNQQLLSSLRGAAVTPQEQVTPTSAGAVASNAETPVSVVTPTNQITLESLKQKLGLITSPEEFKADPISSIQSITKQVFASMGLGEANSEIKTISNELEKLENKRDEEIRAIQDDPWLTEGVKLRQIENAKEKASDEINNRVNKLQLLESVRDNAQQQAQFALGTAISIYDMERKFQADQIQQYYSQAQKDFENSLALYELSLPKETKASGTSEMQEYMLSVEQGFAGSFLDYKTAIAAAGRAPSSGDGTEGPYTKGQLTAITKINDAVSKNAVYARTASMRGYIDNINAALSQQNGLSDIAAINQFQKVIDEGAVTRDQDVVLIQGAQSLANQLNTKISALQSGQQLGTNQRTQMRTLIQQIYNAQVTALNKDPYISAKKKEASLYGLTENDTIIGELGGFDTGESATSVLDNIVNSPQSVYTPASPTPTVDAGGGFWKSFSKVFGI